MEQYLKTKLFPEILESSIIRIAIQQVANHTFNIMDEIHKSQVYALNHCMNKNNNRDNHTCLNDESSFFIKIY